MNLFSVFDSLMFKYHFIMTIIFLFFMTRFWKSSNKINFSELMFTYCFKMFYNLKMKKWNKSFLMFFINTFILVMIMNLLGLFPYSFSLTSQMSVVLFLSSIFWLMINLWNLIKNFKSFMSHTIPEGTPMPMIMFLFMIEIISNFIRPLTLTLRLMGNMVAGHIFLTLIFMLVFNLSNMFSGFYILYMVVEFIISMLQAYIISTLMVMYYSEI